MPGCAHLIADERDRIADLKAYGLSLRAIARALGRAASTISRELQRNALALLLGGDSFELALPHSMIDAGGNC